MKRDLDESRCCHLMYNGYGVHQCSRKHSVERDGKKYCKQHDPDAVKARREASIRKIHEDIDAMRAKDKAAADAQRITQVKAAMMDKLVSDIREFHAGEHDATTCPWCKRIAEYDAIK